jgi:peptidase M28-like protein
MKYNRKWAAGIQFMAVILMIFAFTGCKDEPGSPQNKPPKQPEKEIIFNTPEFNGQSAFTFVAAQVEFGPRVPGSEAHEKCKLWLQEQMSAFTGDSNVIIQQGKARLFNNKIINLQNIIVQFNPHLKKRILLMAHWDTRMFADHDPDINKRKEPVLGANDGGSGVGVLLEIARILQNNPLSKIGVDIILFDAEDQGTPDNMGINKGQNSYLTWCLGSQYWSRNKHRNDASYKYGILLDMVGDKEAVFPKEGYSRQYASRIVKEVWQEAKKAGYGNYFVSKNGNEITDDHYFVNTLANIPSIDIIHYNSSSGGFGKTWHTHDDNMENISEGTLKAVGQTVLRMLYKEEAKATKKAL